MHPILGHGRRLALYLGIWALVGLQLCSILVAQAGFAPRAALLAGLPPAAVYAFVCLSAWYVSRGLPLASTGAGRLLATAFGAAAISSALWLFVTRAWVGVLLGQGIVQSAGGDPRGLQVLIFGFGVLLYLLSIAISYLIAIAEERRAAERRALLVQVSAREAELRALRAQIDPHFLFNSLQSISALTSADPPGARRMSLMLAEFLRDSLALGGETRIPLARELRLVERFLAIEQVRFGSRLRVALAAPDEAGGLLVPALLLQPIVENAVTHGIAHVIDGGVIRVDASRTGGRLTLVVENPCDADRPRGRGAGVGLANVRARLEALHGEAAWLHAAEADGRWRVEVSIPAEEVGEDREVETVATSDG